MNTTIGRSDRQRAAQLPGPIRWTRRPQCCYGARLQYAGQARVDGELQVEAATSSRHLGVLMRIAWIGTFCLDASALNPRPTLPRQTTACAFPKFLCAHEQKLPCSSRRGIRVRSGIQGRLWCFRQSRSGEQSLFFPALFSPQYFIPAVVLGCLEGATRNIAQQHFWHPYTSWMIVR